MTYYELENRVDCAAITFCYNRDIFIDIQIFDSRN